MEWRAATAVEPATGKPAMLAFTSLVRAVAFIQPAVKAGAIGSLDKIAKFRAAVAQTWDLPLPLNPPFDELQSAAFGPPYPVDPQAAATGDEL